MAPLHGWSIPGLSETIHRDVKNRKGKVESIAMLAVSMPWSCDAVCSHSFVLDRKGQVKVLAESSIVLHYGLHMLKNPEKQILPKFSIL
jgi:hypothetical protein